ncbi:hypothetical protein [Acidiphilium sp.]
MLALFGHYATFLEFAGLELVVVVAASWSLISVRRSLKRDRAAEKPRDPV